MPRACLVQVLKLPWSETSAGCDGDQSSENEKLAIAETGEIGKDSGPSSFLSDEDDMFNSFSRRSVLNVFVKEIKATF